MITTQVIYRQSQEKYEYVLFTQEESYSSSSNRYGDGPLAMNYSTLYTT